MDELPNYVDLASEIVAAYVSHNPLSIVGLPALIVDVHAALVALNEPAPPVAEELRPAVSIRKSVTPEYLICLEDGQRYRTLKRHLSILGMTPDQYRAKWHLPSDYPMVSADYSLRRSELAKSIGLGGKRSAVVKPRRATKR